MPNFQEYITRQEKKWGNKFNPSNLALHLCKYYESQERIEVKTPYGETKRGRIGITTGWNPTFLLMARKNACSSSEILTRGTVIIKVISK